MKKFLFIICILIAVGCEVPKRDLGFEKEQNFVVSSSIVELDNNQKIDYVDYSKFNKWINSHLNITIQAIASVNRSGYGATSGFLIVYTESENE